MLFRILTLLTLVATSTFAYQPINPSASDLPSVSSKRDVLPREPVSEQPITNAKRFAMGLPPLKPRSMLDVLGRSVNKPTRVVGENLSRALLDFTARHLNRLQRLAIIIPLIGHIPRPRL